MPPETGAAAPGVSGASKSSEEITPQTEEAARTSASPAPAGQTPVGERAQELLKEMGVSDEVQEIVKPEGTTNADDEKQKAEAEAPGDPGAPDRVAAGQSAVDKAAKEKADEEEPVTAEEKKTWPPDALERIHKATAKYHGEKTAREKAEALATERTELARQLHEQLQNATSVKPPATAADPLADVLNFQDLQSAVQSYEDLLEWAEKNPDGLTDVPIGKDADGKPVTHDYSAQEMAEIRAKTGRILRQAVPARAAYLQEKQQHEAIAREKTPEMFDPKTEEHKAYRQFLTQVPEVTRIPGFPRWIGWAFKGRQAEIAENESAEAAKNGNGKQNGKTVVDSKVAPFLRKHPPMAPSVPSTRGSGPAPAGSKDSEQEKTVEQFTKEGGGDQALERLLERTRDQQRPLKRDAALV